MDDPFRAGRPAQFGPRRRGAGNRFELAGSGGGEEFAGRGAVAPDESVEGERVESGTVGQRWWPGTVEHRKALAEPGPRRQPAADLLERVAGDDPERRQLAAGDRDEAALVPDDVVARLLRRI